MDTTHNAQIEFERFLIMEYLRIGSINKVFQNHKYNLPISFAGYDRVLTKYKVIKSAGPNSKLSESLYILSLLANYKIPLEKVYQRYAPKTMQVSTNTLHRILHYTRLGMTRRQGVALIISPKNHPEKVLLGKDQTLIDRDLGKKGNYSLPMGHSKINESIGDSIARVLQNEVFTEEVISNNFPWKIIPKHIKPSMYINIADIQVSVYTLEIPNKFNKFSSYKLSELKYMNLENLPKSNFRSGVTDILKNYKNMISNYSTDHVLAIDSELNTKIYALAKQPAE